MLPENEFHAAPLASQIKPSVADYIKRQKYQSISVEYTTDEIDLIEKASAVLECDPEFFINDAAVWKAKAVMKRLEYDRK